jgi:hypothetical protein
MFMLRYSICVVTYINRFEKYFKPLVKSLERIFPEYKKIYILNGYYDQIKQQEYLRNATEFLQQNSSAKIIAYNEHQALAKCWNQAVLNSPTEKVLVLNDDLFINSIFKLSVNLQITAFDSAIINNSWSHFFISKQTIKRVGWFDERFAGMGFEDGDYALRLAQAQGRKVMPKKHLHNIYCLGVKNVVAQDEDPGWKMQSSFAANKYSQINQEFFYKKWEVRHQPFDGAIHFLNNEYCKLRPGMETPDFYRI